MQLSKPLVLFGMIALVALSGCTKNTTAPQKKIELVGMEFVPKDYQAKVGETVHWINMDGFAHDITDANGVKLKDFQATGDTFDKTFDTVGTWKYWCTLHAASANATSGMVGSVIVSA
jgi:plastocyanin